MITGAKAMVLSLQNEGVPVVFGYPGAAIAPFYQALERSGIHHILTRGEQAAGHAASGYARMTGRPGVCIATSGPGATNLFTAIATAHSDSISLVAITGQVARGHLGRDVFQEVDATGAVSPFAKHTYLVRSAQDLPRVFKEAFYIAASGRPGPVLIDVPVDVQDESLDFSYPESVSIRGYKPRYEGHPLQIKRVVEALRKARRPVLCIGGGIFLSGAQGAVRALCEKAGIPLVTTMMGIGAIPANHPLFYGMLGQSGTGAANAAITQSDLLVLIGARVGDRAISRSAGLEAERTIVHIDIDSAEIGKNLGTTIPLVGDAEQILAQLLERDLKTDCADWIGHLDALRNAPEPQRRSSSAGFIDPRALVREVCRLLPEQSVYVSDVGQNQIWSARNFCAPGRFLTSGGMGTMGYALPAAIGAKLAAPEHTVVAVCGDGAFQMSMAELATACQHGVPVKVVVMKNGTLGMVREIQVSQPNGREMAVGLDGSPDFGVIARAYGIPFGRLESERDMSAQVQKMFKTGGPYILECVLDKEERSI